MLSKEFIETEIADLEREIDKAANFVVEARGALNAWRVALSKLDDEEGAE